MKDINQNIDLNLYRTFCAVVENKSFSKAAEKLFISQPAISYNIKELEKNLNVKLFYRAAKGVTLTTEGETLYYYIKNAYDYIYMGEQSVRDSQEILYGNIKIGVPAHIGMFYLSNKIEDFHNKYPNIKFYIQNRSTTDMVYMLERHQLDFIIDSYPIDKCNLELNIKKIVSLNTVFIGKTEYVNDNNIESIEKENIENLPLILPNSNTSTRKRFNQLFEKDNMFPNPIMEVSTTEMTLELLKKGIGIGWLIEDTVKKELNSKEFKKINTNIELPKIDIGIAYINDFLTYAPKRFIEEEILWMKEWLD